ncbi:hypothetical protein [Nonomuraea sp. GTA35]|uniref:hypothetical protein n=1 Tax=Nonomuraea sp. GTA35 TaxID=1676746 RepID=UPI0035C10511
MAAKGQTVEFSTVGGNTVDFVYEGGPYDWGRMTCNGCKVKNRVQVGTANKHAATCRAK